MSHQMKTLSGPDVRRHATGRSTKPFDVELLVDGRTSNAVMDRIEQEPIAEIADSVLPELRMHQICLALASARLVVLKIGFSRIFAEN